MVVRVDITVMRVGLWWSQ